MIEHKTVELEFKETNSGGTIVGYASVYGNVDQGGDIMMKSAFKDCIARNATSGVKPKMLWQHDPSQPIGVWDAMQESEKGLMIQGRILPTVQKGKEAIELIRAGAISGLSVGYKVVEDEYEQNEKGMVRKIHKADLWETSIVTFPMNEEAMVTDVKQLQSLRDVEYVLRKAGVPSGFAKLLAKHGYEGAVKCLKDGPRDEAADKVKSEQLAALIETLGDLKGLLNAQG